MRRDRVKGKGEEGKTENLLAKTVFSYASPPLPLSLQCRHGARARTARSSPSPPIKRSWTKARCLVCFVRKTRETTKVFVVSVRFTDNIPYSAEETGEGGGERRKVENRFDSFAFFFPFFTAVYRRKKRKPIRSENGLRKWTRNQGRSSL